MRWGGIGWEEIESGGVGWDLMVVLAWRGGAEWDIMVWQCWLLPWDAIGWCGRIGRLGSAGVAWYSGKG